MTPEVEALVGRLLADIAEINALWPRNARSLVDPEDQTITVNRQTLEALLAALSASAQEPGWVLVPREPTEAMVDATVRLLGEDEYHRAAAVWSAMIAAAPSANAGGEG